MSVFVLMIAVFGINAQDFDQKLDAINNEIIEGKYESALESCKAIMGSTEADTSQIALANSFAAIACEEMNQMDQSIAYYKEALRLQVPRLDIYDRMIMVTRNIEDTDNYEYALLEKKKAFPDFAPSVDESLTYHYVKTKQYEKLLESAGIMMTNQPDNSKFVYYKALAFKNLDQMDSALVYYEKVLEMDPDNIVSNAAVGLQYFYEGNAIFKNSKASYDKLSAPSRVDYDNYKKSLEKGKKVYEKALPYLLKAYESGKYNSLKPALVNIYTRLDQADKATEYK